MKHLSEMQKSSEVVHVLPAGDAVALANAGMVRKVTIDPAPARGKTAVSLTTRGRTATTGKPAATAPKPPETSDTLPRA